MASQRRDELFLGGVDRSSTSVPPLKLNNKNESLHISNTGENARQPSSFTSSSHQEPPLPRMRRRSAAQLPYPDRPAVEREQYFQGEQHQESPEESPIQTNSPNATPLSLMVGKDSRKDLDSFPAPPAFRARQPKRAQSTPVTETTVVPVDTPPMASTAENPYPAYHQQYWPPQSTLDRSSSIASNITVTARRGSPAPPKHP